VRTRLGLAVSLSAALLALPATAGSHWQPGVHNRQHAIHWAFCGQKNTRPCGTGYQAIRVAKCESGWSLTPRAHNGQYLGMFQMGSFARGRYGHSSNPWGQARAAARYYRDAGWSPWACRP
jgi:hypothetical protein